VLVRVADARAAAVPRVVVFAARELHVRLQRAPLPPPGV
jgi:hypothetical protein